MTRSPHLAVRRTRQTLAAFDNGPRLLWDLASQRLPWGSGDLAFRLRNGAVIHCPNLPGARVPVYEIFAEDAYRLDHVLEGLEAPVVLDIGGHIGCFAVGVALARPQARVHSYEASPATARWLSRNVEANALLGRVTAHHVAVSDHRGTLSFADNDGGSSLNGLTAPSESVRQVDVPCVTFADALADAGGRADVVKIDTEGAEYAIVLGSDPGDWSTVRRVVMEYHDVPGRGWSELAGFLDSAGFGVDHLEAVNPRQGSVWLSRRG